MKAVILADRSRPELKPLTERTCAALLPVGGKPLIEHTLEALFDADIREAYVVISEFPDQVEAQLGDGERWGMDLRYWLSRGDESVASICRRLRHQNEDEILLIRADVIRSSFLTRFLDLASMRPGASRLAASVGGVDAGLELIRLREDARPTKWIDLVGEGLSVLSDLGDFHVTSIEVVRGTFPGLNLRAREVSPHVHVGRRSVLPSTSIRGENVFVGSRSRVHPRARLSDDVVLSEDVIVDAGARLRSVVVLPGTYIGASTEVDNAIVWGNQVIHLDVGKAATVRDPSLLASMEQNPVTRALAEAARRLAAVVALGLSAPLWPLFTVCSLAANLRNPLRPVRLMGNREAEDVGGSPTRRAFTTWEGATKIPWLRHLPRLLSVATGDLEFVGVCPATKEDRKRPTEDWERVSEEAPSGLIAPGALQPATASRLERRMADSFYAATRGTRTDLYWLFRGALFLTTRRAWASTPSLR
ncbi:MAG: NDP-sugar synthase [Acidobacteria bacterium]|nr:MAG: NDP-sugar synthase [Acidobacteriota bacterium]